MSGFALPSLAEIVRALIGVWLIFRRDGRANDLFDFSDRGFWVSFFAAALALPANLLIFLTDPDLKVDITPFSLIVILQIYIILVLAYPLAVSVLVKAFDREDQFVAYIVAHNWANLPIAYLYLGALAILSAGSFVLPDALLNVFTIAIHGTILYLLWRVARATLDVSGVQAVAVVIFEFVLTALLFEVLTFLSGW